MDLSNVNYICKYMLNTDWKLKESDIEPKALDVFDKCQSKLEIMFLLGMLRTIKTLIAKSFSVANGYGILQHGSIQYAEQTLDGIWIRSAYDAWQEVGLTTDASSLMIIPQFPFGDRLQYRHDFVVIYGNNDSTQPNIQEDGIEFAIEVDGYHTHKDRKEMDWIKDLICPYPVVRLREEVHQPLTWFRQFMPAEEKRMLYKQHIAINKRVAGIEG